MMSFVKWKVSRFRKFIFLKCTKAQLSINKCYLFIYSFIYVYKLFTYLLIYVFNLFIYLIVIIHFYRNGPCTFFLAKPRKGIGGQPRNFNRIEENT